MYIYIYIHILPLPSPSTHIQGAQILTAVLRALRPLLRQARLLVLGGCSAGGRGAFYNLEPWPRAVGGGVGGALRVGGWGSPDW